MFANGLGDRGSIPGWVLPKTQEMVLDPTLLDTQHYKVRIKGKVEQSRKGVVPSPTPRCSSYWKGNLQVTNYSQIHRVKKSCAANKTFIRWWLLDQTCFKAKALLLLTQSILSVSYDTPNFHHGFLSHCVNSRLEFSLV